MARRTLVQRTMRWTALLAVGGSAFQLSGCDPAVRGSLVTGLEQTTQSLSSALIAAFFLTLEDDTDAAGTTGTSLTSGQNP